ncbi:GtrA-like protein [Leptospira wolffii serovar Khorat str. Khorat-H2]|nr:GtrA-like protein [Leptospira wolffii serovar Khorat str. Khorat-H2]
MIKKGNAIVEIFSVRQFRYIIAGLIVFGINLLAAHIVFSYPSVNATSLGRNIGNLIATEIPIIVSYPIHKFFTWRESFEGFFSKFLRYHLVLFSGIILRITAFLILDAFEFSFYVSTIVGILIVIVWNFLGFDRFVFVNKQVLVGNTVVYSEGGTGVEILETVEEARTYNEYLASKITPFLGEKNLEIGAGTGTIANLVFENGYHSFLTELSDYNAQRLRSRFRAEPLFLGVEQDFFGLKEKNHWDCVYSSNVLEHVQDDWLFIKHGLEIVKQEGWFVAIVPATKILYSEFDKRIGHYRRYGWSDKKRIVSLLKKEFPKATLKIWKPFNPVGALGWFIRMRLFRATKIKLSDAMIMDSLIPFLKPFDYLPLPVGQAIFLAIRKGN